MDGKAQTNKKRKDGGGLMKRQVMLALVAVLAVGAVAQAATSQVDVYLGPLDDGFDGADSYSYASAYNGLGGSDWGEASGLSYYSGPVNRAVAGASAYGQTGYELGEGAWVKAGASASTAGVPSAGAYGQAYQNIYFEVGADGPRSFTAPWEVDWAVDSGGPGGTAYVDGQINMALYVWAYDDVLGADDWLVLDEDSFSFSAYAWDGGAASNIWSGDLTVSGNFYEGEYGSVLLWVDAQATATIPAPGAVVLGFLGTGLVGFWRRRNAL
jgi:hypothetical protein